MLSCSKAVIAQTLDHLHDGGTRNCETVVLWLGRRSDQLQPVLEVYRPDQIVDIDYFRIPSESMRALSAHLRANRLHILGQVHSHPELAFHSRADNEWAIVRHIGAVSLVVPWFGRSTTPASFIDDIAAFRLSEADRWVGVPTPEVLEVHE
jgi:proteasome lid subunit RPN8/RPN11